MIWKLFFFFPPLILLFFFYYYPPRTVLPWKSKKMYKIGDLLASLLTAYSHEENKIKTTVRDLSRNCMLLTFKVLSRPDQEKKKNRKP